MIALKKLFSGRIGRRLTALGLTIALAVITVILLLAVYLPMFTMYGGIA